MYKVVLAFLIVLCLPFISFSQAESNGENGKRVFEKTIIVRDANEEDVSPKQIIDNSLVVVQKHKSYTADGVVEVPFEEQWRGNNEETPSKAMASNLSPYTPSGWPAPVAITNVSTHTLASVTDASTIYSNEEIYVNFAALNNGADPTPSATIFLTRIFVDNVLKFEGTYNAALQTNSYVYWINRSIGTLTAGFRTFRMEIDPTNVVSESNESDNTYSRSKAITAATTAPAISSFTPTSGSAGIAVTILGSNFGSSQGSSTVRFGTTSATVISWGNGQIIAAVPSISAGNYTISVTTSAGTGNSGTQFTVTSSSLPTISSFTPSSGAIGSSVTINGSNFGATQGASAVRFGSTIATVTSWSSTQIIATVPSISTALYTISVTTSAGTRNSSTQFTVLPIHTISSFTPSSGVVGSSVTISGSNFGATQGSSVVRFGSTNAAVTSWNNTQIVATVPSLSNGSYTISVTINSQQVNSSSQFSVISSLIIPTLLSPSDGATQVTAPLTLSWSNISLATFYEIEIGGYVGTTLQTKILTSTSTSKTIDTLGAGITYYWRVRARNLTSSSLWTPYRTFTSLLQSQTVVNTVPAVFPSSPKSSTDYRLIIVPSGSGKPVNELFTGKPPNDYRIFRDNGNTPPQHLEELNESSTLSYQEGVWLIKKNEFSMNTSIDFRTQSQGRILLPLRSGWNIIGNPFSIPVNWSDVLSANGISPTASAVVYSYQGESGFIQSDVLQPFSGYYYFHTAGSFYVPFPFASSLNNVIPEPSLALNVRYRSSVNSDNSMVIGVDPDASDNMDNFEKRKPPVFSDQGSLYFDKPDWDSNHPRFASDIRPSLGEGQTWNFILNHPQTEPAQLSITGIENLSQDYKVVLLNKHSGVIKYLDATNSFSITSFQKDAQYSIIVGKANYIKARIEEFIPQDFMLHQNFPNPFNPATAIGFGLSKDAFVQLTIYDLLGREVASLIRSELTSGVHEFSFNAKNLSSGTYIYSMKATSIENGKLLYSSTKKMMLLK